MEREGSSDVDRVSGLGSNRNLPFSEEKNLSLFLLFHSWGDSKLCKRAFYIRENPALVRRQMLI